jgi:hypothetical protein
MDIALAAHNQGIVLSAIADALKLDLAVAPVVIAREHGIGIDRILRGVSQAVDGDYVDFRVYSEEDDVNEKISAFKGGILKIDGDNLDCGNILGVIADRVTANTIVCIVTDLDAIEESSVLTEIEEYLNVHRAHVPTARLSATKKVDQPVLLVGNVSENGSKRGERYFTVGTELCNEIHFHINGLPHQNDDDLYEALDDIYAATARSSAKEVALRLERDSEGRLELAQNGYEVL